MMRAREIKTNIDDFRRDVILSILTAFPGRAVDDEDPSNDSFLIDGVSVKVEADRIIIGDDYSNSIPLKGSPIAGNPPQYRDIDSIISDFKLYVSVVKAEERYRKDILSMRIKESVLIPGTSIILEKGDRIYIKER